VDEEDLMSFDTDTTASMIMNSSWDEPTVKFNKDVDFPALIPVSNNVASVTNKGNGSSIKSSGNVPQEMSDKPSARVHKQHNSVTHIPQELNDSTSRVPTTGVPSSPGVQTWDSAPGWGTISSSGPAVTSSTAAGLAWDDNVSKSPAANPLASVWGGAASKGAASATLFPNAPPAVAPPPELMQSLSADNTPPKPMYDEHNPKNPNFNAARYYNQFSQGYKCPHYSVCKGKRGDKKTVQAFVQHLLSPIHQDHEKVTCQRCLRVYVNATAFVQHFESQTIRCDARTLGNAGAVVREIAQVITTEGERHEDETVVYINTPGLVLNSQEAITNMGAASRQAAQLQAEHQVSFWEKNTKGEIKEPKW
jgi:hypothetical protein